MTVDCVVAFKELSCLITIETAKEKCGTATHAINNFLLQGKYRSLTFN